MTDETNNKKTLTLSKNISLRSAVERDQVRQSFSHGRSKTVEVEIRRKRNQHQERGHGGHKDGQRHDTSHGLSQGELENRLQALKNAKNKENEPGLSRPVGIVLPEVVRREPVKPVVQEPEVFKAPAAQETAPAVVSEPVAKQEPARTRPAATHRHNGQERHSQNRHSQERHGQERHSQERHGQDRSQQNKGHRYPKPDDRPNRQPTA